MTDSEMLLCRNDFGSQCGYQHRVSREPLTHLGDTFSFLGFASP